MFKSSPIKRRVETDKQSQSNTVPIAGSVAGLAAVQRGRVLVGGKLVYASFNSSQNSIESAPALNEYLPQPSREVFSGWYSRISRSNPRVRVHVHRLAVSNPKLRVGFLLDGYMAWGRKMAKGKVALLGGVELPDEFQIDVLTFEDGKLLSISDQTLPAKSAFAFNGHLQSLIAAINNAHDDIKIVMAAPLDDLNIPGVTYIGDRPCSYIRFSPLRTVDDRRHLFVAPAAICLAAVSAYSGLLAFDVAKFRAEGAQHDLAVKAPEIVQRNGKMDAGAVSVMTQRRQFMETQRPQADYARTMARVVRGLKPLKDATVEELIVPAPMKDGDKESAGHADVRLIVSMPAVGDSVFDQAVGVVDMLTQSTRMGWRLVPQGAKEDGKRRSFTLEGVSHG